MPSDPLTVGLILAVAGPALGGFGYAVYKIGRRFFRWIGQHLIVAPVKQAINEVIDDRVDERLSDVTESLATQGIQLNHLHDCIERRTEEIVAQGEEHNEKITAAIEESRTDRHNIHARRDDILLFAAAERERIWAAIVALGGTRPAESLQAIPPLES